MYFINHSVSGRVTLALMFGLFHRKKTAEKEGNKTAAKETLSLRAEDLCKRSTQGDPDVRNFITV